jgi:hypothetical protein
MSFLDGAADRDEEPFERADDIVTGSTRGIVTMVVGFRGDQGGSCQVLN